MPLAAIPSPSGNGFTIGPLQVHVYALMYVLGIIAAVALTMRLWGDRRVAQAIGRVGNFFNQELFGGPTALPWALEIDREHRPDGYEAFASFHPTFLYVAGYSRHRSLPLRPRVVRLHPEKVTTDGEIRSDGELRFPGSSSADTPTRRRTIVSRARWQ